MSRRTTETPLVSFGSVPTNVCKHEAKHKFYLQQGYTSVCEDGTRTQGKYMDDAVANRTCTGKHTHTTSHTSNRGGDVCFNCGVDWYTTTIGMKERAEYISG